MKRLWRSIHGSLLGILLATGMSQAAVPALAAGTLTVHCKGGDYATIQDAVNAASAGSTIKVCAGTYQEYVLIASKNNLKLVGSGIVIVEPPSTPANGAIISVAGSLNVKIQGLTVYGANRFTSASTTVEGIDFAGSSGSILNNSVVNIRRNPISSTASGAAINVDNAGPAVLPVTIQSNTITDFGAAGISIVGKVKPTIVKNVIKAAGKYNNHPVGIVMGLVSAGKITGNTISFDDMTPSSGAVSVGIHLQNADGIQITKNKISDAVGGILLIAACGEATNGSTISGNTIRDAGTAILLSTPLGGCIPPAQVKSNHVVSNKLYDTMFSSGTGILVSNGGDPANDANGNVLKSNQVYGYLSHPIDTGTTATTLSGNKTGLLPPPGF